MRLSDRTSTYLFTTPVLILSCLRTAAVLLSDIADVRKVADGGTEVSTEGTEGKLGRRTTTSGDLFFRLVTLWNEPRHKIRSAPYHAIFRPHPLVIELGSESTTDIGCATGKRTPDYLLTPFVEASS